MSPDELSYRIDRFFAWYFQRLANLESLTSTTPPAPHHHLPTYEPDQHVLIGAGLDSLAKHWARAFPKPPRPSKHGPRMQAFLVENANSMGIWHRAAAPMLRAAAMKRKQPTWAQAIANAAGCQETYGLVRGYEDDPPLDDLTTHPSIIEAKVPAGFIEEFLHGRVLYREYRCGWLHEFDRSEELAPHGWDGGPPRYQNILLPSADVSTPEQIRRKHRLVFSLPFLLKVYREAITTFKDRCLRESADPVPR